MSVIMTYGPIKYITSVVQDMCVEKYVHLFTKVTLVKKNYDSYKIYFQNVTSFELMMTLMLFLCVI